MSPARKKPSAKHSIGVVSRRFGQMAGFSHRPKLVPASQMINRLPQVWNFERTVNLGGLSHADDISNWQVLPNTLFSGQGSISKAGEL